MCLCESSLLQTAIECSCDYEDVRLPYDANDMDFLKQLELAISVVSCEHVPFNRVSNLTNWPSTLDHNATFSNLTFDLKLSIGSALAELATLQLVESQNNHTSCKQIVGYHKFVSEPTKSIYASTPLDCSLIHEVDWQAVKQHMISTSDYFAYNEIELLAYEPAVPVVEVHDENSMAAKLLAMRRFRMEERASKHEQALTAV